jgi:ketosteroid isomerase-like protein
MRHSAATVVKEGELPGSRTAAEVMQAVYEAWLRDDQDAVDAAFASNLRFVIPGSHPFAGEYVGFDKAVTMRERLEGRVDRDSVRVSEISPVTDEVARLDVEFAAVDAEETFPIRVAQWYRLDGRGKIREVTLEPTDPAAWDRLFAIPA